MPMMDNIDDTLKIAIVYAIAGFVLGFLLCWLV